MEVIGMKFDNAWAVEISGGVVACFPSEENAYRYAYSLNPDPGAHRRVTVFKVSMSWEKTAKGE